MDLKKLDTFRSIARYGSLRKAAARHGLTLPAISIQLRKLEAELGAKLFDHLPNKLLLTDQGRVFLDEINWVFEALDRAKASIGKTGDEYSGTVSISLASDIASVFANGIADFVRHHPKLNVAIRSRPSRETLSMVANGDIDLGVGFFRRGQRGITKKKIGETNIALVFPSGHPLERIKQPTLQDVAAYRLIVRRRESGTRQVVDAAFADRHVNLPSIVEVTRCQTALDFVELGLGVGLVHTICACTERREKLVRADMSEYFGQTDIALVTRSKGPLGAAHGALMRVIMNSAAEVRRAQQGAG